MSYHWDADDEWDAGVEALRAEVIAELDQDDTRAARAGVGRAEEADGAMSKACESVSLNEYPCVKPAGHDRDHERYDGRTWPEGQTWGDVIAEYFRSQGIDPDAEDIANLLLDDLLLDELAAGRESLAEAEERRYREYMESQPDLGE